MNRRYGLVILFIITGLFATPRKSTKKIQNLSERELSEVGNIPVINQDFKRYIQQLLVHNINPDFLTLCDFNYDIDAYSHTDLSTEELIHLKKNNFEAYCIKNGLDYEDIPASLRNLRGWRKTAVTDPSSNRRFVVLAFDCPVTEIHGTYSIDYNYFNMDQKTIEWRNNECIHILDQKDGITKALTFIPKKWIENN